MVEVDEVSGALRTDSACRSPVEYALCVVSEILRTQLPFQAIVEPRSAPSSLAKREDAGHLPQGAQQDASFW